MLNLYHSKEFNLFDNFLKILLYNNINSFYIDKENSLYLYHFIYSYKNKKIHFTNLNNKERDDILINFIKNNFIEELKIKLLGLLLYYCPYNILKYFLEKYPDLYIENELLIISKYIELDEYEKLYYLTCDYNCDVLNIIIQNKIEITKCKLSNNNVKYILKLLDIIDLSNLSYKNNYKYLIFNNININKKLFLKIINNNEDDIVKNDLIIDFINCNIINCNNKIIQYIFENKFTNSNIFIKLFIRNGEYLLSKINDIDIEGDLKFYDKNFNIKSYKIKQAHIFNTIVSYINKHNILLKIKIVNDTYNRIIKLPNILESKLFLEKNIGLFEYCSFKYMYIDIVKYILEIKEVSYYTLNDILEYSLFNKNNNLCKYILSKYDFTNININYNFILSDHISENNIKNKLKIMKVDTNFSSVDTILHKIFSKTKKVNLKKWALKYYCNNKIKNNNLQIIFDGILLEKDDDLLEYFLEIYKGDYWELVYTGISCGYCWFSDIINKILYYCYPLEQNDQQFIDRLFYNILVSYNYHSKYVNKRFHYMKYYKLIKYFKKLGCSVVNYNVNVKNLLYYIGDTTIFKCLIYNGSSYHNLYEDFIKNRNIVTYSPFRKFIKLYILIKRLEFRIRYRNKKNHYNNFRDNIIDIVSRPPNKNVDVLNKGGLLFYKDMDEFNKLYDNEFIKYKKPIHIEPSNLIEINNKKLIISQKVDGTLKQNIDYDILYPKLNDSYENIILDGEYIKELDLYLIFGQRSHIKNYNNYFEDFLELRENNDYFKINTIISDFIIEDEITLKYKLEKEIQLILTFFNSNTNINKWLPKQFYKINNNKICNLDILKAIQQYQYNIYSKCLKNNDLSIQNYINNKNLKMDGIIIYQNTKEKDIYKLKSNGFLTADIKFDNIIYRCNYINNNWIKDEIRLDKLYPNPDRLIKKLEYYNNNYWTICDIKEYLLKYYNIYYELNKDFNYKLYENKEYFRFYKNILNCIIKNIIDDNKIETVIDLGCGFLNNNLWKMNINITGIDIDIKIINKFEKMNNKKKLFIYDFTEKFSRNELLNKIELFYEKYYRLELQNKYDLIFMNMSIHNIFYNNKKINNFINNIKSLNSKLLFISYIDPNIFSNNLDHYSNSNSNSNSNIIILPNNSYIKKINKQTIYKLNNSEYIIEWIEIYYSWRHIKPMEEPLVNLALLNELLKDNIIKKIYPIKKKINNKWNKILENMKFILYSNKNI